MKSIITFSMIIFSFFVEAQEIDNNEKYFRDKAELYDNAYEKLDISFLPEEEKAKFKQENLFLEYLAEKAYFYYTTLIDKFPRSKNYLSDLFNKGRMAADIEKSDEAKKCLRDVIKIAESEKQNELRSLSITELSYYQKLSFYYLVRICESESNCLDAKHYVLEMVKIESDKLNDYQNGYIADTVERINRNCTK